MFTITDNDFMHFPHKICWLQLKHDLLFNGCVVALGQGWGGGVVVLVKY